MDPAQAVAVMIARYRPRSLCDEVAAFARAVVTQGSPHSGAQAKAWLFAAGRLGTFCAARGVVLSARTALATAVIERFISTDGASFSAATRRTVRSSLRGLQAAVLVPTPRPMVLSRERSKAPYSDAELAGYFSLARHQPTPARRQRACALLCLGAGAGLRGGDLRGVRGADVVARSGGVVVVVGGRRPRVVPVRARFSAPLLAAAAFAGEHFVIGGREIDRRTVTTPLVSSLAGGRDLPALDTGRLRATWLVACARDLSLKAFMDAAGVTCSQRLGDLVSHLETPDEATSVAVLSGGP